VKKKTPNELNPNSHFPFRDSNNSEYQEVDLARSENTRRSRKRTRFWATPDGTFALLFVQYHLENMKRPAHAVD
jgi:hypothetical protein